MISIGLDAVDIVRFAHWYTFSHKKLRRVFSENEITYCLSEPIKSAERFAVRFAAKEALYKALSPLLQRPVTFLALSNKTEIRKNEQGYPYVILNAKTLDLKNAVSLQHIHVSLSHTANTAIAMLVVEYSL